MLQTKATLPKQTFISFKGAHLDGHIIKITFSLFLQIEIISSRYTHKLTYHNKILCKKIEKSSKYLILWLRWGKNKKNSCESSQQ